MPLVTDCELWIRSTDIDSDGIVNNARYFEFFEQGRAEHLLRLGVWSLTPGPDELARSMTVAETRCRYRAALYYRDWIVVRTWTSAVRTRSWDLAYAITRRDDGAPVAEGSSAQVWLDAAGRAAQLPERVRALLVDSLENAD
jgi:YbgC/YbaW family acyl-CoA thioester hydrolase